MIVRFGWNFCIGYIDVGTHGALGNFNAKFHQNWSTRLEGEGIIHAYIHTYIDLYSMVSLWLKCAVDSNSLHKLPFMLELENIHPSIHFLNHTVPVQD